MQTKEAVSGIECSGRSRFIFFFDPLLGNSSRCSLLPGLALGPPQRWNASRNGSPRVRTVLSCFRAERPVVVTQCWPKPPFKP